MITEKDVEKAEYLFLKNQLRGKVGKTIIEYSKKFGCSKKIAQRYLFVSMVGSGDFLIDKEDISQTEVYEGDGDADSFSVNFEAIF